MSSSEEADESPGPSTEDEAEVLTRQLGGAMRDWLTARQAPEVRLRLEGPFPAAPMDPSWFLRIEAPFREADLLVFSDGRLDLSWYDPRDLDAGMRNEGHGHLSPTSLVALLERLVRPEGAV